MKKIDITKLEQLEQMIADRTAQIAAAKVDVATAEENLASATNELETALHGTDVDEGVRATVKKQMFENQYTQRQRDLEKLETEPVMTEQEYREVCRELCEACREANNIVATELAKALEKFLSVEDELRDLFSRTNRAMFDAKKYFVCDEKLKKDHYSDRVINTRAKSYDGYYMIQFISEIRKRCEKYVSAN